MEAAVSSVWQQVNADIGRKLSEGVSDQGWIGAGTWAQTLSKLQGSLGAAGNAVPSVSPPTLTTVGDAETAAQLWYTQSLVAAGSPLVRAQLALASGKPAAADSLLTAMGTSVWKTLAEVPTMNPLAGLSAVGNRVWVLGVGLIAVADVGGSLLNAGGVSGGGGGVLGTIGSMASSAVGVVASKTPAVVLNVAGALGKSFMEGVKPVLIGAGIAIIVTGLGLCYVVPALPYIRFLFAVASWLIAVLEAVIMVVTMLVLLVTPEGDGFLGPHARATFMNLVALVLRPLLTLAGFVAGLALASVLVGLLNATMLPMVREIMGGGIMLVSFVAYLLLYLGVAYVLVNLAAKTPDTLAGAVYRWLGANGGNGGDEAGAVGSTVSNVAQSVMREIAMRSRSIGRR